MHYRKRSEFGLRRSFFAADGPSSSITVLNQKLESAAAPPLLHLAAQTPPPPPPSPLTARAGGGGAAHMHSSAAADLYSISPIVFDTTVGDYWQRVTM